MRGQSQVVQQLKIQSSFVHDLLSWLDYKERIHGYIFNSFWAVQFFLDEEYGFPMTLFSLEN